jgi:hypothetical protein
MTSSDRRRLAGYVRGFGIPIGLKTAIVDKQWLEAFA